MRKSNLLNYARPSGANVSVDSGIYEKYFVHSPYLLFNHRKFANKSCDIPIVFEYEKQNIEALYDTDGKVTLGADKTRVVIENIFLTVPEFKTSAKNDLIQFAGMTYYIEAKSKEFILFMYPFDCGILLCRSSCLPYLIASEIARQHEEVKANLGLNFDTDEERRNWKKIFEGHEKGSE